MPAGDRVWPTSREYQAKTLLLACCYQAAMREIQNVVPIPHSPSSVSVNSVEVSFVQDGKERGVALCRLHESSVFFYRPHNPVSPA
jgi:hypothetical protein